MESPSVKKKVKKVIDKIEKEFQNNPLMFFNESDIVCRLVEELKKEFPEKIKVISEAVNNAKKNKVKPSVVSRVHTELDIPRDKSSNGPAPKIDIAILKKPQRNEEIVLKGKEGKWSSGTPSSEVDLDDIVYGIEVKFFRNIQEYFTPNEITGWVRTQDKLMKLMGKSILLIFSHGKVKGEADIKLNNMKNVGVNIRRISSNLY